MIEKIQIIDLLVSNYNNGQIQHVDRHKHGL